MKKFFSFFIGASFLCMLSASAMESEKERYFEGKFHFPLPQLQELLKKKPVFKKMDPSKVMNEKPLGSYSVHPLFPGDTKIKKRGHEYLYIPEIKFGTALIITTENHVGAGHFIEKAQNRVDNFINSMCDLGAPQSVTVYGTFFSESTEAIIDVLHDKKISVKAFRIAPVSISGDMIDGDIPKSNVVAIKELLVRPGEDHTAISSGEDMLQRIADLNLFPCQVAIDCVDGQLMDFNQVIPVNLGIGTATAQPKTFFNYGAMNYLLDKKNKGEIKEEEVSQLIEKHRLMEG